MVLNQYLCTFFCQKLTLPFLNQWTIQKGDRNYFEIGVLIRNQGASNEYPQQTFFFLHFHSFSSFYPVPLFHLLFYLFSPFLWVMTQNDPQGLTCR